MKQKVDLRRLSDVAEVSSIAAASRRRAEWPADFVELYEQRFGDLVRVAYLMTGNVGVAEELTQDAFLAVRTHIAEVTAPYPYLRAAVVNHARSWHRRQRLERRKRPDRPTSVVNEPDEMWDALQNLGVRRRTAIVLRFYEQLPDAEIAEILDCAQATVRTLVRRGLADLRKVIEQ